LGEIMPRGRKATSDITTLEAEATLVGLELKRTEIENLISKIKKQLGGRSSSASTAANTPAAPKTQGSPRKKRVLSAEARKRIAAAQKRRWAEHRKTQAKSE
jgi:hypothetical protein